MPHRPDIALSYAGVHELFQLALAAHEMDRLEAVRCSLVDAPGKWGRMLSRRFFVPSARPLGLDQLPTDRISEHPWPVLVHRLVTRLLPRRRSEHLHCNDWFDRSAARWLEHSEARIYVGTETCALHSMRKAGEKGMRRVLDCPGIPADMLTSAVRKAAAELGLPYQMRENSPLMAARKKAELELAEVIICCSELQKSALVKGGVDALRIRVVPLWVDAAYWQSAPKEEPRSSGPLRVLYAGSVSLPKGVPYLLRAMEGLKTSAELTLVGNAAPEMQPLLSGAKLRQHLAYVPKDQLREIYRSHDVLVMPSLGDSFGFVALEAMAAGLPVIVSDHAGVPVPDETWRVPAMSSEAILGRLQFYASDSRKLVEHGAVARSFAARFTPQHYRNQVAGIYRELLTD